MTRTPRDLEQEVKRLSNMYLEPEEWELDRYMPRIERLVRFYESKVPLAPEKQGWMFTGFVNALKYTLGVVNSYRRLTIELKEISKELDKKQ